jgi:3-deoxy-D-manno-octulosonate 8-phosphate phosphatase (KDO 8-P phosphatase)
VNNKSEKSAPDLSKIKLLAFDVDGVFTDGRFYLSDDGIETKAFCTQDGYGVRH